MKTPLNLKLFAAILVTALPVCSQAATYYVDAASGKDSNSGTSTSAAWKTIAKVNSRGYSAGDFILFKKGGVWREQLSVTRSGVSGNPITYGAYGSMGGAPMITGANLISASSWRPYNGSANIFVAPVTGLAKPDTGTSIQLYVDDTFYDVAHYPNDGFMLATKDSTNQTTLIDSALALDKSQIVGATLVAKSAPWAMTPAVISGYDSASHTITTATNIRYAMRTGYGYYLRNQLWMLDSAKEWYYDANAGLVYVWLPTGDKPSKHKIEITARNAAVSAGGKSDIVIRDLVLNKASGSAVTISSSKNIVLDRLTVSNASIGVNVVGMTGSTVSNSSIKNMLNEGIHMSGTQNTITGNLVSNVGVIGITPDTTPNSIYVVGGSSYTTISNNNVSYSGYNGINFNGSYNTVSHNVVDQSCIMLDDCSGIYTWAGDINNTELGNVVDSNTVSNSIGNMSGTTFTYTQAEGIYIDDLRHDVRVTNNVVTNTDYGIFLHNNYNDTVSNNHIYGARMNGIRIAEDSNAGKSGFVRNNVVTNNAFETVNTYTPTSYTSYLGLTDSFGSYDKNIYCHPSAVSAITRKNADQGVEQFLLADWQKKTGQDLNSSEVIGACPQQLKKQSSR